jgi:hypothetical protein
MILERAILRRSASAGFDSVRHQRIVLMFNCLVADLECGVQAWWRPIKALFVLDARRASCLTSPLGGGLLRASPFSRTSAMSSDLNRITMQLPARVGVGSRCLRLEAHSAHAFTLPKIAWKAHRLCVMDAVGDSEAQKQIYGQGE